MADVRRRKRESVRESLANAPSTILANLFIEVFAAIVMIVGLAVLFRFITAFHDRFSPAAYRNLLIFMILFAVGWGTNLVFRFSARIREYRGALARDREENRPGRL
jgi:Na+-translocating ferredoxin:NAD+ oxidoreductase RnfA subunit